MDIDLNRANAELLGRDALGRMSWAAETFGAGAVLLSSMQKTSSVLMHLLHRLGLGIEVLFVDTGFHFHETLALRDEFMRRYKLDIRTLYPEHTPEQQEERFGCKLYRTTDGQPICCDLRKGKPFIDHMVTAGRTAVFGGLRRAEGGARGRLTAIAADPRFGGYRVHPIVDWDDAAVEGYLAEHGVPTHPLHGRCYPSVGCQCCTTAVRPGEDARAGRWRHLRDGEGAGPSYCGINFSDGSGI
jgi:phosphoadenosine phosphosulfate reductase